MGEKLQKGGDSDIYTKDMFATRDASALLSRKILIKVKTQMNKLEAIARIFRKVEKLEKGFGRGTAGYWPA